MASESAEAIQALREELVGLRGDIREYGTAEMKQRRNMKILAGSVIFDVLLSVGLYLGYDKANTAAKDAKEASSARIVNCLAGNESRQIQADLWEKVLGFDTPPLTDPVQEAARLQRLTDFKTYIDEAFQQRECK